MTSERTDGLEIVGFYESGRREHWLSELGRCDWDAGAMLHRIVKNGEFFDTVGEKSEVLLLTRGDELLSFCTYAEKDDVQPTDLTPWIGFVFTFPEHRGRRLAGLLIAEAERRAGEDGFRETHISTEHEGLYEKYGYELLTVTDDVSGRPTRVYVKKLGDTTRER